MIGNGKLASMKRTLVKVGLLATIALAFIGVTMGTLSWFSNLVVIDNTHATNTKIEGSTMGAYFAYGDGIPNTTTGDGHKVYGINKPRHLYNLAWLQYLGFFATDSDNDGKPDNQYYFEIDPNLEGELDMTGWTLPPIGTANHPFVGNFNGNGKIIKNLTVSNDFGDFNTHPSDVTAANYVKPNIVGFFGIVGNYSSYMTNDDYDSSINEIKTLGLKDLSVETSSSTTLVGLAAGYVDATIENVAIQNPTLVVSDSSATNFNDLITNNISDYLAVGYCHDTNEKRYTADISKVTNTLYSVNVKEETPFTITEQGSSTGWGGSIDMLEMYTKLDAGWKTLVHGYTNGTTQTVNPLSYDTARTDTYDVDGHLTSSNVTSTAQNNMPYKDYGQITGSGSANHKYYNISKNSTLTNDDTSDTENLQTSSISYVVEMGATQSTEERFMCLTGRKDVPITDGLSLTTNNYPTYSGQYISTTSGGQTRYLTVTNNAINNSSTTQTTIWTISDGKLFTANSSNEKVYLVCSNAGALSLTTAVGSASTWVYDSSNNSFSCTIGNNTWVLVYDNGAWKCQTFTVDHYLIHTSNNVYLKHRGTTQQDLRSPTYAVSNPSNLSTETTFWWYKNGDYYRTTNNGNVYLTVYNGRPYAYTNGTNYAVTYDGTYFSGTYYGSTYYLYYNSANNRLRFEGSTSNKTPLILEPVYTTTPPSVAYSGSGSFKAYNSATTTEDATLSIPHTYFPLRYDDNNGPDVKNTGYVVSGGNYFADPYGDIRVSAYGISTYLQGVSTTDSTDSQTGKKYKSISTVYTKQFNTSTGALNNTNADANTVYANSEKYKTSKSALQYVFGGQSNAYGLHFMKATISGDDPAIVPGAVINGSIYKNLELPTDCIDFNLKEKGIINFFAGSYYTQSGSTNTSFFSLYEIDRKEPTSTAKIVNTENAVTLTYKGIDSNKKLKFAYDSDPFNVAGHTFDHITINGNTSNGVVDGVVEPFNVENYPGNSNNYFTFSKGSKKYEYFNLKFYDDQGVCYLEFNSTTQRTKLNEIRRIERVFSASADTAGKQSYCYQYKIGNNTRYSVPYMYVMGRKVDLDGTTPYVEGRLLTSKPSGYDTMEFSTQCIEVGPHGGSLATNNSKGYVYYFEIPMNEGEFALGSVDGYNGAYLMYLDIAANASLINRTTITEHFVSTEGKYKYPLGVAIVENAANSLAAVTPENPIDPTESVYVTLDDAFRGVINIELSVISTVKTATLVRANMPNAPNGYTAGDHADIEYINDDLAKANGTKTLVVNDTQSSFTGEGSLDSTPLSTITRETRRINFYDFSVTDGVTWTQISEVKINDVAQERTVVQEINDVATSESSIKIYGTDGKTVTKDNVNFASFTFDSSTTVVSFSYMTDDYEEVTVTIDLDATINSENYYEYDGFTIVITNTGDQIKVKFIAVGSNVGTITVNGSTPTSTPIYVPNP